MKKTIMYCPLNDGHIISEIKNFAQQTFEENVGGFRAMYGKVALKGTNPFQELICTLPTIDITKSDILLFDKVVADYEHKRYLDLFWEKNKMELEKPSVSKSTVRDLYFVVAALMQLKADWAEQYSAKEDEYSIDAKDSYSRENLDIKGYRLKGVHIAVNTNDDEVSVCIDLGSNVDIRLSDITAFGSKDLKISNEKHLYDIVSGIDMRYFHTGSLLAPCIEERMVVKDHLKAIHWTSEDSLYQVHVENSEALTKLKLNEKGVEARAETVATTRMVLGCSASNMPRSYRLIITHGLVVDIRYKKQSIFVAYVPQERFIKK